jgi:hypothetical protein
VLLLVVINANMCTLQLVLAADVQAAPARTFEVAMAACGKAEELDAGRIYNLLILQQHLLLLYNDHYCCYRYQ